MLEGRRVGDSWGSSLHRSGSWPGFGPAALPLHPFPPLRDHFHGALEGPIQPPPPFRLGWGLQIHHPKLCNLQKLTDLLQGQSRRRREACRGGRRSSCVLLGGSVPPRAGGEGCVCPSSGHPGCCTGRCWGTAHSGCSMGTASRPFACWAPTSLLMSMGEWDALTLPFLHLCTSTFLLTFTPCLSFCKSPLPIFPSAAPKPTAMAL